MKIRKIADAAIVAAMLMCSVPDLAQTAFASGGDAPAVKLTVIQAVAALTGLSRDRITVAKWQ